MTAIHDFVRTHRIDCELRLDGALYIATNKAQEGMMNPVAGALSRAGLPSWKKLALPKAQQFAGTQYLQEGFFSPSAGSVQPALLVRGMAVVARKMGIRIYDQPTMLELNKRNPPEIQLFSIPQNLRLKSWIIRFDYNGPSFDNFKATFKGFRFQPVHCFGREESKMWKKNNIVHVIQSR